MFWVGTSLGVAQAPATQVKAVTEVQPTFPAEAKNPVYGDVVRVAVNINKKGVVTAARAFGPLAPCSDLKDPVVTSIRRAAEDAAKKYVFEPVLNGGKPIEVGVMIPFRLQPRYVPSPADEKKIIRGGVLNGRALSLPKPDYPAKAKANRVTGAVEVEILISEDGSVISAGSRAGHPDLIDGAVESACAAKFTPTLLSGQPVKVSGIITYNFIP